jgi:uncharacterized protein YbgA (DUF1722 family)
METTEINKYENMNISELETTLKVMSESGRAERKRLIDILDYVKKHGRWKENPRYAKTDFYTWLDDNFYISKNDFLDEYRAYSIFPDLTKEYGVGLVMKVWKAARQKNVTKVFARIKETEAIVSVGDKRAHIANVIETYRVSPAKNNNGISSRTHWKEMYEKEVLAHEKTKKELASARKELARLNDLKGLAL